MFGSAVSSSHVTEPRNRQNNVHVFNPECYSQHPVWSNNKTKQTNKNKLTLALGTTIIFLKLYSAMIVAHVSPGAAQTGKSEAARERGNVRVLHTAASRALRDTQRFITWLHSGGNLFVSSAD